MASIPTGALISACLDLAEKSGEIIRSVLQSGKLDATDKASGATGGAVAAVKASDMEDPQTIADLRSQKLIFGSLRKLFPALHMVGEEGDLKWEDADTVTPQVDRLDALAEQIPSALRSLPAGDTIVWIDPLDGTKEFTKGRMEAVTVLIGVSTGGKAVAGVVHSPFSNKTLWGVVGMGAFSGTAAKFVPAAAAPSTESRRLATTASHLTDHIRSVLQSYSPENIIHCGGAGYKVLLTMDNTVDAYVYPSTGTKRWDTCAPEALIRAAGGTLTDAYGVDIPYVEEGSYVNNRGVLATMRRHADFILPSSTEVQR